MADDDEGEEVPEDDVEDMENMTVGVAFNSTGFANFLSLPFSSQTKQGQTKLVKKVQRVVRRKNEVQKDEVEDLRDEEEDVTKPEEQVGARCLNIRVHFLERLIHSQGTSKTSKIFKRMKKIRRSSKKGAPQSSEDEGSEGECKQEDISSEDESVRLDFILLCLFLSQLGKLLGRESDAKYQAFD